jgi:hypothetical protein
MNRLHVVATPDDGYPIRILEAYLHSMTTMRWEGPDGDRETVEELNMNRDRCASALRRALDVLRTHLEVPEKGTE